MLAALMGTGLVVSVFYLQGSTDSYFKSWGGTASAKVQTTNVIDHFKGVTNNTGAPTPGNGSGLMTQLSKYEGNLTIAVKQPIVVLPPKDQVPSAP